MTPKYARNYVATVLAMRTHNLRREAATLLATPSMTTVADVAAEDTQKVADLLGFGPEYLSILAHIARCNPV